MTFNKIFIKYLLLLIAIILLGVSNLHAQSRKELENKKKKIKQELAYTKKLLQETKKNQKESYNKLLLLNKQISIRGEIITNISDELSMLNARIRENLKSINNLSAELTKLKQEYANMIYFAYKNKSSYDRLMFIMSAKDFNQAYKRLKYFQQYSDYRKKQVAMILSTQQKLKYKLAQLQEKKNEKKVLLDENKQETEQLTVEQGEQNKVIETLKSKETELVQKMKEQKLIDNKLKDEIDKIIAEEMRKAEERRKKAEKRREEERLKAKAESENKNKNKTNNTIVANNTSKPEAKETINSSLTPEDQITSDNFGNNKGRLPWPTERGTVISPFGEHEHPILKGVKVKNNGIDIGTSAGASVRSIFDGTVSRVFPIPGGNKAIIIRHGNYLTVYSNLKEVTVSTGDKVKSKQKIGVVYTDEEDGNKSSLHLEIWKESTKQNPAQWLAR